MSHLSAPDPLFKDYAHDEDRKLEKRRSSQIQKRLLRVQVRGGSAAAAAAALGSQELSPAALMQQRRRLLMEQHLHLMQLELVGGAPAQKNWKGIIIALVVIVTILALISCAIAILTPKKNEMILGDAITFTEAMTLMQHLSKLKYQWVTCGREDTLIFLNDTSGNLMKAVFDPENGSATVGQLLDKDLFSEGNIQEFTASEDCLTILIPVAKQQKGKYSSFASYKVISLARESYNPVTEKILCPTATCDGADPPKLQLVQWGSSGKFIVFVYQRNLYYVDNPFGSQAVKITDNFDNPALSFGATDWFYEEEVLQTDKAVWISPDNRRIAYLLFNDTPVSSYPMPWYGSPSLMQLQSRSIRYPIAGAPSSLPAVSLHVYSLTNGASLNLTRPAAVPLDNYLVRVEWFNSTHLIAAWLDRSQTSGYLAACDATALRVGHCQLIFSDSLPSGWMEFGSLVAHPKAERVLTVLHNSGYRRVASIRLSGLNQVGWVSQPIYDIAELVHFDPTEGQLYFLSSRDQANDTYDATKMHLHRIAATENAPTANCITCLSSLASDERPCEFNRAAFSPSSRLMLQECLGPEPFRYLVRRNSYADKYPLTMAVEENDKFVALLQGKNIPRVEFRQLRLRDKTTLESRADPLVVNAKLVLPKQLNESHISQYPLIMHVHSGPSAQLATRQFSLDWQHYLASSLFLISVSVDARGTRNRGSDFLFSIKGGLDLVDLEDQMDSLGQLAELQYVNKSAIAAVGWSHGAHLALQMLGHHDNVNNTYFATAVALAPVTDYHYYNSGYTERYLGVKTEETSESYKRTNVSRLAAHFWNKNLLMAHGSGDTNVHYQHSAQLAKVLVKENVDFEFLTYPDDNQRLSASRVHLYQKVTTFLLNSFNHTSERFSFLNSRIHRFCRSLSATDDQC